MLHACNTGKFTDFSRDTVTYGHVCIWAGGFSISCVHMGFTCAYGHVNSRVHMGTYEDSRVHMGWRILENPYLEDSRFFGDGYFGTVCVSLSCWMEQPTIVELF